MLKPYVLEGQMDTTTSLQVAVRQGAMWGSSALMALLHPVGVPGLGQSQTDGVEANHKVDYALQVPNRHGHPPADLRD